MVLEAVALQLGRSLPDLAADLCSSSSTTAVEVHAAGLDLLPHPSHPHREPQPATGQGVDGGHPLGEDDGLVVGQHEHAGGQTEVRGLTGQERQQVERVGELS